MIFNQFLSSVVTLKLPIVNKVQRSNLNKTNDFIIKSNKIMKQSFENLSVLLVDDETKILNSLKNFLNIQKMNVYTCSDGESAIKSYDKMNFDLVILDVNMPKMNGLELYKTIINKNPKQKFIFITGYSQFKLPESNISQVRILKKPFEFKDLLAIISELLSFE